LLLLTTATVAQADWAVFRSVPIEVVSNGGDKTVRQVLATLDQEKWLAARLLGRTDLPPLWPLRIVVVNKDRGVEIYRTPNLTLRRDAYTAGMIEGDAVPRQWLEDFAHILLNDNIGPLPASIENGLIEVLANITVVENKITIRPPTEQTRRTRDWARMHMLAADGGSRVRVFFQNLQQSAPIDTAFRNSFGKSEKEMEADLDRYIAAADFAPINISGKPINPDRDFRARAVFPETGPMALADLLTAEEQRKAFQSILNTGSKEPDALEGAGLYAEATQADSKNARAWAAYAETLTEPAKSWDAYQRAAQLNARWEEPHLRLAALEKTAERRIPHIKKAIQLAPRRWNLWLKLADTQLEAGDFAAATESWKLAEIAAPDPAEKIKIAALREQYEQKRSDQAEADRRRIIEEKERELAKLKEAMMTSIRAAETKANAGATLDPNQKPVEWWDDKRKLTSAEGTLERIDCLSGQMRLAIRTAPNKLTQYLIVDPTKIMIEGGGERTLTCGPQRPVKKLKIEFEAKANTKLATVGEVAIIAFR